ncbi:MAG: tRNA lysidine(34) synthetase TilS [Myxococcota bacterium]
MLLAALERTLGAQGVTRSGSELVLVACSGGVDSVALAHGASILLGARRVVLGHVDHAVRPASGADADGVVELAAALGVAVRVTRLSPGPDDEASLRDARYAALEAQRADVGAQWILTAHTQNDQAETVLMGLFRSASPRALGGMPGVRGRLIRPLLSVSRDQLAAHVHRHQLPVFEDATNREPRYLRNRVRKELMPLIETRYRARLVPRLAALADRMRGLLDARSRSHLMTPESDISPSPHSLSAWSEGRTWLKMERQPWSGQEPPNGQNEAVFDAKHIVSPRIRMLRSTTTGSPVRSSAAIPCSRRRSRSFRCPVMPNG